MSVQALDHLGLSNNKKVWQALSKNSAQRDTILWSAKVDKINRKGKKTSAGAFDYKPVNLQLDAR
jgi:hypothetical protein